jgi:hypothetical protein
VQADEWPFADQGPDQRVLGKFEIAGPLSSEDDRHQERMPKFDPVSILQGMEVRDD